MINYNLNEDTAKIKFPSTRYQGSKLKLLPWLKSVFMEIEFDIVLDAFGGTGAIAYLFKSLGKRVIYNDYLVSNYYIGKALIENKSVKYDVKKIKGLFQIKADISYKDFIQNIFKGIYYTDEENKTLDIVVQNIMRLENIYEKSLCYFALFQACLQKRPFNLFHRKNLNLRFNDVKRSFGNKRTWDTPIQQLFTQALKQGNGSVFDNRRENQALNLNIFDFKTTSDRIDLIYCDPPYFSNKGVGVDYHSYYHFLEGLCHYDHWPDLIDYQTKHRRLIPVKNQWNDPKNVVLAFDQLFNKFQDFIIAVSYRNPGIPSIREVIDILASYKKNISVSRTPYKYVLTTKKNQTNEVLIIGQ
ncbi:DNA adenine methylase [Candidatus Hodarchaeum mangrovi]